MPELPEVETVVRGLIHDGLIGQTITAIDLHWPRSFATSAPRDLVTQLTGRRIVKLSRRAKYIIMDFDTGLRLLIHLRMTGKLLFRHPDDPIDKHDHVVIHLADKRRLVFNDTRKFGRFMLCSETNNPLSKLGPEPLDPECFTFATFKQQLGTSRRSIKERLLDQTVVAGLGNIYVDETLFRSGIHPQRKVNSLTDQEMRALHTAIPAILATAVQNCGTTLGKGRGNFVYSSAHQRGRNADNLNVFRRDGEPCFMCGSTIKRMVVGQRGTHFCPQCQPLTKRKKPHDTNPSRH